MASATGAGALVRRLDEGPLLGDGAMGTMLYARGVPLDACFDVLNLNEPKVVQGIHAEYIQAGADCIETNTFGANRFKLAVHGLTGRVREINLRGARLARDVRETMGRDVFVLGSIGPLGKYLAPLGTHRARTRRAPRSSSRPRGCSRAAWTPSSSRRSPTSAEIQLAVRGDPRIDRPADRGPGGVHRGRA